MTRRIAEELLEGLADATAFLEGKPAAGRVTMLQPAEARAVRHAVGGTQAEFAQRFGIPIDTLRKWEQGKRQPDAVGRSYLRLIAKNPQFVEDSVRANVPGE
ncbi:MAG: helix-turn-helix domain-containing protein [Elstera sp.]|jgi:putative transcriptional regulator